MTPRPGAGSTRHATSLTRRGDAQVRSGEYTPGDEEDAPLTLREVRAYIQMRDSDGDGVLSFEEFVAAYSDAF